MTVKKEWNDHLVNFTPEELMCKRTGGYAFHPEFAKQLQLVRSECGFPFYPASCCRSRAYNASLRNSSSKSLHVFDYPNRGALGACAIDLRETNSIRRAKLLRVALNHGFSFYFINKNPNSIHLDLRTDLGEEQVVW